MLRGEMLPWLSWLEREAVNLKVGSSSLPGSAFATVRRGFRFFLLLGEVWRSKGLLRELNLGSLAPEARIMPLDQAASCLRAWVPGQFAHGAANTC